LIDTYPGYKQDESGPEIAYSFHVDQPVIFRAHFDNSEPAGTDIDIHLLDSIEPLHVVARDNNDLGTRVLQPGTYFLILDSFQGRAGQYSLSITGKPYKDFNAYVLKAVDYLASRYAGLGYDNDAVLTHNIPYGQLGIIRASGGARTMCVAAVMEVLLTAMDLYQQETGDGSVYQHLPLGSWTGGSRYDIRAHLFMMVFSKGPAAAGPADALVHFGMGLQVPFKELTPGSFVNMNRTNGTGHAVVFLAFIDKDRNEYATWNSGVIGFKYFSAQGTYSSGGLGYRWAAFSGKSLPYDAARPRDTGIIYSEDQVLLNTGMMLHPSIWTRPIVTSTGLFLSGAPAEEGRIDFDTFTGKTTDDEPEFRIREPAPYTIR
jgi:hypothetical protein